MENAIRCTLLWVQLAWVHGWNTPLPISRNCDGRQESSNPDYNIWMRQDELLLLGIIGSLKYPKVVSVIRSCKTSAEVWNRLANNYANPSSSRTMGLAEQLTLISRGSLSSDFTEYFDTICDIANELALIGAPIPNQYLITNTLNGVGFEFKVLAAVVRSRDTVISFDELHDKPVEYEAFLKREELRYTGNLGNSTGNLSNITVNAARFSSKNGNQYNKKNFQHNKGNQVLLASKIVKATISKPTILETKILVMPKSVINTHAITKSIHASGIPLTVDLSMLIITHDPLSNSPSSETVSDNQSLPPS
ncbi:hypothetical protein JRO89_XS02G0261100 [Xanthoceras sorbifolium]|uniref:Uncharacterized protein n=1 Tax=Xanthoceras sorbifolium TaxID=99658 RepID=A0ABQ8IHQ2_9ROSI|nr:hypothetical protein JRO89_XS02G0261100 [Xanthoceras sorbifolium]